MTNNFGLSLGVKAPSINSFDVFENKISMEEILKNNNGLIIDFSRGAW